MGSDDEAKRSESSRHSESAEEYLNLVTYTYVKVKLYMWINVWTYTCGTEFLSPAHYACVVINVV